MASPCTLSSKYLPANKPVSATSFSVPSSPSTLQFLSKPTNKYLLNNPPLSAEQCSRTRISTKTSVSFFSDFLTKSTDFKEELLKAIQPLDRGADATPDDQHTIDQLARKLESVNPTKQPLKSDLLNGKWELVYTTSRSILQTERPKFLRSRVNYQAINVDTLRAQNMETWPFFNQDAACPSIAVF